MNDKEQALPHDRIIDLFRYCETTGDLFWRKSRQGIKDITKPAGIRTKDGYRKITIRDNGKEYKYWAHRLVYFYHYKKWARPMIDHIDRDPSNNRIENLRESTASENNKNSDRYKGGISQTWEYVKEYRRRKKEAAKSTGRIQGL